MKRTWTDFPPRYARLKTTSAAGNSGRACKTKSCGGAGTCFGTVYGTGAIPSSDISYKMDKPDLAMTLTVMDGYYLGNTCLTLEMAYLNARAIAKPVTPWLLELVK